MNSLSFNNIYNSCSTQAFESIDKTRKDTPSFVDACLDRNMNVFEESLEKDHHYTENRNEMYFACYRGQIDIVSQILDKIIDKIKYFHKLPRILEVLNNAIDDASLGKHNNVINLILNKAGILFIPYMDSDVDLLKHPFFHRKRVQLFFLQYGVSIDKLKTIDNIDILFKEINAYKYTIKMILERKIMRDLSNIIVSYIKI